MYASNDASPSGRGRVVSRSRAKALRSLCALVAFGVSGSGLALQPACAQTGGASSQIRPVTPITDSPATEGTVAGQPSAGSAATARATISPGDEDLESRPLKQATSEGSGQAPVGGSRLFSDVLGKLGMVLALIFVCAAVWKRLQAAQPKHSLLSPPGLQIVTTLPLGAQRFLHVVAAGRCRYLIGSSPQSISLLATLDEETDGHRGRAGTEPNYGALAHRQSDSRSEPETDDVWGDGAGDGGDRFEELLLRLRRLEDEQVPRGRPGIAYDPDEPYLGRGVAPSAEPLPERRGRASREGGAADPAATEGRALAPGSLFRSASDGPRGGRHA
jgi:flagellar biogenesis protein FliO